MNVSDIAIWIAAIAFCITQIHLALTARKLLKRNDASWTKAQTTIFEAQKVIHDDCTSIVAKAAETSGLDDVKITIAELGSRVNSLPTMLDDRLLKLQGGLRESFVSFGDSVAKTLESCIPKFPQPLPNFGDPKGAQAAGVEARKINQIITTLEGGVVTGGDIVGAANDLGQVLAELGEPNLQEWLVDHPNTIPKIYGIAMRHPRLAKQMQAFQQRFLGGDGGRSSQGSRGGEV